MSSVQVFLSKIELRALCFVLCVAVASLAVVVVKKNEKIAAFRIDLAEAHERISALEATQAEYEAGLAVQDVRGALAVVSGKTKEFQGEISKLTSDLKKLVTEATTVAEEKGGVFDELLGNVQSLIQRFQGEVPALQENIESLANTIENKVSKTVEEIEQNVQPQEIEEIAPTDPINTPAGDADVLNQ